MEKPRKSVLIGGGVVALLLILAMYMWFGRGTGQTQLDEVGQIAQKAAEEAAKTAEPPPPPAEPRKSRGAAVNDQN